MKDAHRYVPVLKWKAGEQTALRNLTPDVKQAIFPLLEVVDVSVRTGGGATKSLREHLNHAASQMEKCWGTSAPLLLDTHLLSPGRDVEGASALAYVVEQAHALNVAAVPVVSTDCTPDDLRAVAGAAAGLGVAVRAPIGNVVKPSFPSVLMRTLKTLGVSPGQVDFVLDVREVGEDNREAMAVAVEAALTRLPATSEWRSLTVAAAAFPVNLTGMKPGLHMLPRADWTMWTSLSGLPRQPDFGDYAIAHPDLPNLDMRKVKVSASIRYTAPDSFVVARGRVVTDDRHGGYAQFITLSGDLVNHRAFAGPSFSWGDDYIVTCADGGPSGNLTTWRQVGTNHHITMVVKQLAKWSGS